MTENIEINLEQKQTPDQKSEDWPSDYFDALQTVYRTKADENGYNERYLKHEEIFYKTGNIKEAITALLILARDFLGQEYGFWELTLTEIKSLVEIVKRFSNAQLTYNTDYSKYLVDTWLFENYGICKVSDTKIDKELMAEDARKEEMRSTMLSNHRERNEQFVDYVRKIRNKALLAEKK